MRAAIVALDDLSREDVGRWRELAAEAAEPNPFFEPEYVLPAADLIGGRRLGLAVVREAEGWSGCLPVCRPRRWHRVPLGCVATWHHKYSFLGTPLVRSGREASAMATLLRELLRQRGAAFVGLDGLPGEGPVRDAVREAVDGGGAGEVQLTQHRRAVVRRRPTPEQYPTVKGTHRRDLGRRRRRLADELGGPLQMVDRAEEAGAVDEFLALEAAGWKGERGTALASVGRDAEFFRQVCESFRELGRLHVLSLEANGHRVAQACNVRAGDGVFGLKIAFDERWRRESPGAQLVLDHVPWFHRDSGAQWMDSCAEPDNELVNRLWPDSREIVAVAVASDSPAGRLTRAAIAGAVRLRQRRAARP